LDFEYFHLKISEVESAKRDSIPKETQRVWFIEAVERNWDRRTLDLRCRAVLSSKVFGAVQFNDLLEAEEVYTKEEIRNEAERIINYRINEVKRFKEFKRELTEQETESVALMAWKEIQVEMRINQSNLISEAKEKEKERIKMELSKKRKHLENLPLAEKTKIVNELEKRQIITGGFESSVILHNLGDYCNLIPDDLIKDHGK
jgi:hypothetical protein